MNRLVECSGDHVEIEKDTASSGANTGIIATESTKTFAKIQLGEFASVVVEELVVNSDLEHTVFALCDPTNDDVENLNDLVFRGIAGTWGGGLEELNQLGKAELPAWLDLEAFVALSGLITSLWSLSGGTGCFIGHVDLHRVVPDIGGTEIKRLVGDNSTCIVRSSTEVGKARILKNQLDETVSARSSERIGDGDGVSVKRDVSFAFLKIGLETEVIGSENDVLSSSSIARTTWKGRVDSLVAWGLDTSIF